MRAGVIAGFALFVAACRSDGADRGRDLTSAPNASDAGSATDVASATTSEGDADPFYVRIGKERWVLSFIAEKARIDEADAPLRAMRLVAPPSDRALRCARVEDATRWIWLCTRSEAGILIGRAAETAPGAAAPAWSSGYPTAFVGWSARTFEGEGTTRVFEVDLGDGRKARLRVGTSSGRLKVWSRAGVGTNGEEREMDLVVTRSGAESKTGAPSEPVADSADLRFVATPSCADEGGAFRIEGRIQGRRLGGRFVRSDGTSTPISGERAEILTQGLEPRTDAARAAWQARTRARLRLLALGGDPPPIAARVTKLDDGLPPLPHVTYQRARDDDPDAWPAAYRRHEILFEWDVEEPWSGALLTRRAHAWLMVPEGPSAPPAPTAGRPMLLSLNGHLSSGWRSTDPDDIKYWFAEGFARRGWVVLALDVGHRTMTTREGLYADIPDGDHPAGKNLLKPAIAPPGEPSAWEEMGERAWDAERAAEYLRALPGVDPRRTFVMGHSMGGEVALWAGALDTNLGAVVSSGFAGDYGIMANNGAHPCFLWLHGDVREFIDSSDLAALVAPRTLVVMQGKTDGLYSALEPRHGLTREFFRRASLAWGAAPFGPAPGGVVSPNLFMYLHYDEHYVHVGDRNPTNATIPIGLTFSARPRPTDACNRDWQNDDSVVLDPRTLPTLIQEAN